MSSIRYVSLSDLHLGADNSLLTHLVPGSTDPDPSQPSPVLMSLVDCLRTLLSADAGPRKPTLILNGDLLELALANDNVAAMAFERFMELVFPAKGEPLFEPHIYFLPGNHDHHLWETTRERQYLEFISHTTPGTNLEVPWHATNMFDVAHCVPVNFLETIVHRYPHLKDMTIRAAYPNLGFLVEDGAKCLVFSHGHFTESIYSLMTTLRTMLFPDRKPPVFPWDFEAENFAWVDFLWSTLGRSGDVGTDLELIYDKLQSGPQVAKLLDNFAHGFIAKLGEPGWLKGVEAEVLRCAIKHVSGKIAGTERGDVGQALSPDGRKGLREYLEGPLRRQILLERRETMPRDITFVFGHTHKPFQEDDHFRGYPEWTSVYNSGGWVVDTTTVARVHGGAVVLVDDDLHVASLRMYNEADAPPSYSVVVEAASHDGAAPNPLYRRLQTMIDAARNPWKSFSETVAAERVVYAKNLETKIRQE